jgi:anhydro-N-acetylmuramic acid kinase
MSGTSLDGADAVLVEFTKSDCRTLALHHLPYPSALRADILALQDVSENELEKSALLANTLSRLYAETVRGLLRKTHLSPNDIVAIGCHGQTVRHRPELGFTLQLVNASFLAELTQIDVIADFRSRDIAAGGQGAPLVPAFHQAVFSNAQVNRTIINIGGIANLTYLPMQGEIIGFDSGVGNMLMDAWAERHTGQRFDANGAWAETGQVIPPLLNALMAEPYLQLAPPKSTGRDLFKLHWLSNFLKPSYLAQDVQRTLLAFTAQSIANAVQTYCPNTAEIYLCGGGAYNHALIRCLQQCLHPVKIALTDSLGIQVDAVEAAAFAWLARQTKHLSYGNMPSVTGANGFRILGAVYAR